MTLHGGFTDYPLNQTGTVFASHVEATERIDEGSEHWHLAWRFALEMEDDARDPEILAQHVGRVFERPEVGLRPKELMYRAWPLLGEPWKHDKPEFGWEIDEARPALEKGNEIMAAFRTDSADAEKSLAFVQCPPEDWEHPIDPGRDPCIFWMGSPNREGLEDEHPRHQVWVQPFQMLTTVTKEQYWLFDPANREVYAGVAPRHVLTMNSVSTPLFVKTHDFNVWLLNHTQRFPKRLRLHPHKTTVGPSTHWSTFLGMRLKPCQRCLPQTALRRFNRWLHRLSLKTIRQSLQSFQPHCDAAKLSSTFCKLLVREKFWRR